LIIDQLYHQKKTSSRRNWLDWEQEILFSFLVCVVPAEQNAVDELPSVLDHGAGQNGTAAERLESFAEVKVLNRFFFALWNDFLCICRTQLFCHIGLL